MKDSWDKILQRYSSYLRFERNYAKNTVLSYTRDLRQFSQYIIETYQIAHIQIEPQHIDSFISSIYDRKMAATSQARILSGVKNFLLFLQTEGEIVSSPAEFIESPTMSRKLPDILSVEQIDKIVSCIDLSLEQGHRDKAIIEVLYGCGLRVSELTTLKLNDIFFEDGFVRVTGKGNKQRLVPLNDIAAHNIKLYLEQRRTMKINAKDIDVVFLNSRGGALSRVAVFNIVKQSTAQAGIEKNVSPHTFRHSFATHLLEGGATIRQVQDMLGHESIVTTEIYTHLNREHLRKSVDRYHPLAQKKK